jgi:hypothetical protein
MLVPATEATSDSVGLPRARTSPAMGNSVAGDEYFAQRFLDFQSCPHPKVLLSSLKQVDSIGFLRKKVESRDAPADHSGCSTMKAPAEGGENG